MGKNYNDIIEKAKKITLKLNKIEKTDLRFKRVLGFFTAKNLIRREGITPLHNIRVKIDEILWAANEIEPRILEVLPAAILHYPKNILNLEKLPQELKQIIEAIKKNQIEGPDYKHVKYETFFKWAQYDLGDRRVRPEKDKRITCSFRIAKNTNAKLMEMARKRGIPVSRVLDILVEMQ